MSVKNAINNFNHSQPYQRIQKNNTILLLLLMDSSEKEVGQEEAL